VRASRESAPHTKPRRAPRRAKTPAGRHNQRREHPMNTTTVVPPAPRRKRRRSGLGIYQDRTGRWHLDLIIAGLRRHRSYGHISFEEAKARAKVDGAAFRMERLTGVSATPAVVDITV